MLRRIFALFLRQIYLIRRSPPRLVNYIFWPTLNMMIWGFLNTYLHTSAAAAGYVMATFLGATLLTGITERTNQSVMLAFLEDMWSRNIGNILISPLRTHEHIFGLVLNGIFCAAIGVGTAMTLCYFLFDYSIFEMGITILPSIINLTLTGWWIGIFIVSIILRHGTSGEYFGWMAGFLLTPFMAIYYPIAILPAWAQAVAHALPSSYVFENLRHHIATGQFDPALNAKAFMLNAVYMAVAIAAFYAQLNAARKRGGLLSMSE